MAPLVPVAIELLASTVPALIKYFGGDKEAEVAEKVISVAKQITGKDDPDAATAAINANPELALKFQEAILSQELELRRLSLKEKELYVTDVQDARKYRDEKVFKLGIVILVSFAGVMGLSLYGLYKIVSGTVSVDANLLAAVIGLVGAIIGYFAANAQQVVSYFFGSSAGSAQKSDNISDAINSFKKVSK